MFKKSFYYLWGSQSLSNAADVLYLVALTTFVLDQTGSVVFATLVPFIRVTSQLISGLLAPLMIAQYRLPFLLTLSQCGQFLLFGFMAGYVSPWFGGASLWVLYVFIFGISFLDGWTTPARNALVPRLVADEALLKANGIMAATDQIVQFAGWAVSGLAVAVFGSFPILLLVAAGYGVAMLATTVIVDPTEPPRRHLMDVRTAAVAETIECQGMEAAAGNMRKPSRRETLKQGWVALWRSPRLRSLTLMEITDMIGGSVWAGAFLLVFVREVLLKGDEWWGYINASYFAGAVLGGLLIVALVARMEKRMFAAMLVGLLGYAVLTFWFALNRSGFLTLLIVLLTGPFTELNGVIRQTFTQRSVDKELLPKVLSAKSALQSFTFGFSVLFMSGVAEIFGIVWVYLLAALLSAISVWVGIASRRAYAAASGGEPWDLAR